MFVTTGMVDRGFFGRSDGLRNAGLRSFDGRHGSSLLSFPGAARSHMGGSRLVPRKVSLVGRAGRRARRVTLRSETGEASLSPPAPPLRFHRAAAPDQKPQGSPGSPGSRQSPDDPSLSLHPPGGGLALQLVTGYATKDHLPMRGSHYPELARREHYAFLNEGRVPWLFMALCL